MTERTGLIVLSVLAAALAVLITLDRSIGVGAVAARARPMGDVTVAATTSVSWTRPGQGAVVIERADGAESYALSAPLVAPVDPDAVQGFFSALRFIDGATMPAGQGAGLEAPTLIIELDCAGVTRTLRVGGAIAGGKQTWASVDGDRRGILVPSYLIRELDLDAEDLRARYPLRFRPDEVTGIEITTDRGDFLASGRPLAVHLDEGGTMRMNPLSARHLLDEIAKIRIEQFLTAAEPGPRELRIRVIGADDGDEILGVGGCTGGVAVDSGLGLGCVSSERIAPIAAAVASPTDLIDRELVGATGAVSEVVVDMDGQRLTLASKDGNWLATADTGSEQLYAVDVIDWLRRLSGLASGGPAPVDERSAPQATVTIAFDSGEREAITFHWQGDAWFGRRGHEPRWWPIGADVEGLLGTHPRVVVSRNLIDRDAVAIRRIVRTRPGQAPRDLRRGELASDWTDRSGTPISPATIEPIQQALIGLDPAYFVAASARPTHGLENGATTLDVYFDAAPIGPSNSARQRVQLEIGSHDGERCFVRAGDGAQRWIYRVPAEPCEVLLAPWR